MNYLFDKEHISQRIIKFGVDVRPAIDPKQDKAKLQDYCNWLIEQFPEVFETIIAGPKQLQVQKGFVLSQNKRVELPTFILTGRGPIFAFPQRIFIDKVQDLDIPEKDRIFRKALEQLKVIFADRTVPRVGVINEIVFDTVDLDSVQILASNFKNELWRQRINDLGIRLQIPAEGKNILLQLSPTQARRAGHDTSAENIRFGIIVNVDINNQQIKTDLAKAEINDIITFANDYVPDELIKFLNNEY